MGYDIYPFKLSSFLYSHSENINNDQKATFFSPNADVDTVDTFRKN